MSGARGTDPAEWRPDRKAGVPRNFRYIPALCLELQECSRFGYGGKDKAGEETTSCIPATECVPHQAYPKSDKVSAASTSMLTNRKIYGGEKSNNIWQDLIKHTDPIEAEEQKLQLGLEAIEEINRKINEAIRKAENVESVKDLEGRVEDWKGHKLEHFGELLLHGQFSVIKGDQKGDVEREVCYPDDYRVVYSANILVLYLLV